MFAAFQGMAYAVVEVQVAHMFRDQLQQGAAAQLIGAVENFFLEVGVDRVDASLGVEVKREHLFVEAGAYLLDRGQLFAQGL